MAAVHIMRCATIAAATLGIKVDMPPASDYQAAMAFLPLRVASIARAIKEKNHIACFLLDEVQVIESRRMVP